MWSARRARTFYKRVIPRKCTVGAGYAPPATLYYTEYGGLVCRGGIYAARQFCSSRPIPRRGGVTPPYRAKKCARAAGTPNLNSKLSTLNSKKSALCEGASNCRKRKFSIHFHRRTCADDGNTARAKNRVRVAFRHENVIFCDRVNPKEGCRSVAQPHSDEPLL